MSDRYCMLKTTVKYLQIPNVSNTLWNQCVSETVVSFDDTDYQNSGTLSRLSFPCKFCPITASRLSQNSSHRCLSHRPNSIPPPSSIPPPLHCPAFRAPLSTIIESRCCLGSPADVWPAPPFVMFYSTSSGARPDPLHAFSLGAFPIWHSGAGGSESGEYLPLEVTTYQITPGLLLTNAVTWAEQSRAALGCVFSYLHVLANI